jgi:hypothetical protein
LLGVRVLQDVEQASTLDVKDDVLEPDAAVSTCFGPGLLRRIERDLEPCLGKGWLKKP